VLHCHDCSGATAKQAGQECCRRLGYKAHLYSSCRRCRSCWNSPIKSRSFLRSAAVIAVRVRSLLLPGPQPCSNHTRVNSPDWGPYSVTGQSLCRQPPRCVSPYTQRRNTRHSPLTHVPGLSVRLLQPTCILSAFALSPSSRSSRALMVCAILFTSLISACVQDHCTVTWEHCYARCAPGHWITCRRRALPCLCDCSAAC
jgi:hypothetical protein